MVVVTDDAECRGSNVRKRSLPNKHNISSSHLLPSSSLFKTLQLRFKVIFFRARRRLPHMLSAPAALAILYNVALAVAVPTTGNLLKLTAEAGDEPDEKIGSEGFFLKLGLSAVLVLLGGAFAGFVLEPGGWWRRC